MIGSESGTCVGAPAASRFEATCIAEALSKIECRLSGFETEMSVSIPFARDGSGKPGCQEPTSETCAVKVTAKAARIRNKTLVALARFMPEAVGWRDTPSLETMGPPERFLEVHEGRFPDGEHVEAYIV